VAPCRRFGGAYRQHELSMAPFDRAGDQLDLVAQGDPSAETWAARF